MEFVDKSFCFTGKMAELKRSRAEKEARARGGMTTKAVNRNLDFLIVGSIPSSGWKFGNFGRKIEKAQAIVEDGGHLNLASESEFMEALAQVPTTNSGALDEKVLVATYSFEAPSRRAFGRIALQTLLADLVERHGCHVRSTVIPTQVRYRLFSRGTEGGQLGEGLIFEFRFVVPKGIDEPVSPLLRDIEDGFESIEGIEGELRWFEKLEGSADFVRLIREIPPDLCVPE